MNGMLSAFTKKNKSKSRSSSKEQSHSRKPLSILDPGEMRSTTVKFQSDQPTQIWQASPSPSPTASETARRCRWNGRLSLATDSSDDSSISDPDLQQQCHSSSSSSTSSLDEGLVAEHERRKVRKRRCHKQKMYCQPIATAVPRPRSLSTSSSSSSTESSNENPDLNWAINSASIRSQPQTSIGNPQLVYHPSFGHKVLQVRFPTTLTLDGLVIPWDHPFNDTSSGGCCSLPINQTFDQVSASHPQIRI
ncbi:hypothetical protein Ciccas_002839 [Cichlidogyrus casuarinus]|uniref:Uncharacterized protein n=1 Tax=Cichlidogyrus casuarinus TaxID=1844966 RepID=A0ABD2QG31_9PLAT